MTDRPDESTEIKETDIVFDCPHCGKSLAIDYRGAGLTIPCTDCGKNVQVPIPEGMEITDIDSSEEEQEVRILNLRRSLASAELKIEQLSAEVEELTTRREMLEKVRISQISRFGIVMEKVAAIQKSLEDIQKALAKITEMAREES
jgi:transcription elongation factor Elf1